MNAKTINHLNLLSTSSRKTLAPFVLMGYEIITGWFLDGETISIIVVHPLLPEKEINVLLCKNGHIDQDYASEAYKIFSDFQLREKEMKSLCACEYTCLHPAPPSHLYFTPSNNMGCSQCST